MCFRSLTELVRSTTFWQRHSRLGLGSNSIRKDEDVEQSWSAASQHGRSWSRCVESDGIKILGTPVGNDVHVCAASAAPVEEESKLWERIGWVPDVQCAWQILLHCAGPRCHDWLRTVPPQQSAPYAAIHDSGMWQAVATLLGRMPGNTTQQEVACHVAYEIGWVGPSVSDTNGPSSVLGIVGRCSSHVVTETSCTDGPDHAIAGFSSRRWLFGAVAGRWFELGPWGVLATTRMGTVAGRCPTTTYSQC